MCPTAHLFYIILHLYLHTLTQGKIIIITAPSGSGKTTLVKRLLAATPHLAFSISACTRNPRPGEVNGKDYHFFSEDEFKNLIKQDAFVEWEMVYTGKYYGTLKSEIANIWSQGNTPVVDIDVKGALAIKEKYGADALSIFIQAPSMEALKQRLESRGTETPQTLQERLDKAAYELTFANRFDTIIVNDNLDVASTELAATVNAFI